ncbi:MAG: hypothetical protein ACP5JT_05120 [Thermoplasmata archaeon]
MLFVTFINSNPTTYNNLINLMKKLHLPDGVRVIGKYVLFGKPDALIIFEAQNEINALKFVEQFVSVGDTQTHSILNVDDIK